MMSEAVTKEDLRQFSLILLDKIAILIKESSHVKNETNDAEWVKTGSVRKMLDLSAGSVQNLRISGKVRFKKVLGSYYYNREDLQNLFKDEKEH